MTNQTATPEPEHDEDARHTGMPDGRTGVPDACPIPHCPEPDALNHYHCGACGSGEITSMYGHHGDPDGCPIVDLGRLPGAVAAWVRDRPGAAALRVSSTPERRLPAGTRAYRVRWPDPHSGRRRNRYFAYRHGAVGTSADTLAEALARLETRP